MDSTPPPEDVDMDFFADDSSLPYAPPPHLAERFYRKSNSRRKSSAHSSRRNSLSSRHSHQSSLSAHGGPLSTHVAQHLRRASIIESRKARLADRAAHAERVRLRAALAKSTPRPTYREERALAAQATRERLLAGVAAKCEEEVRRVKKVAEETKEKRAAEHARLKEEMAEKFADAAKRRSAYQQSLRRPRTVSLPAAEAPSINRAEYENFNEDLAAETIQRSWRARQRNKGLADFKALNLTLDRITKMSFEDVGTLLSQDSVLDATARALQTLKLSKPGGETGGDRGSVRILLSIFLILGHPIQTLSFGGKDAQEQDLIEKANELLKMLSLSLDPVAEVSLHAADEALSFAFNRFCTTFHAWKSRDSCSLVDIMVKQFVELDLILQTTKDDTTGGVSHDYAEAIRNSQVQILARLKKFAGPDTALAMIRTAVRNARKQRLRRSRKGSEENIPRSTSGSSTGIDLGSTSESGLDNTSGANMGASSQFTSFTRTMTILPSNREISHEIQVNGTYQVQQQPWTASRAHFVDSLQATMRRSMTTEGDSVAAGWTYAMAAFIREKLFSLITKQHPVYDRLDGFLDLKLIKQTALAGMFSYSDFFETIAHIISQLCSPGRDEMVKEFAADTHSDTITRLFSLIKIIDLMRLDHVNFHFTLASQGIVEHGWQHEREMFKQDLENGVHTLDNLRRWWSSSRSGLAAAIVNGNLDAIRGDAIYARGLVDLVLSNTPPDYTSLPETLRLDWLRLLSLRAKAFKMVATSSILLTTKIRLKRNRQESWNGDAERIMNLLDSSENNNPSADRILAALESARRIPDPLRDGLLNFIGRILPSTLAASAVADAADRAHLQALQEGRAYDPASTSSSSSSPPTTITTTTSPASAPAPDPSFTEQISSFILKSLREHIFTRLSAASTADKVRAATQAADLLSRMGMGEFGAGVQALLEGLEALRRVDLRCHGRWYEDVGREVEA
jgi:T-complex protein 11